MPSLTYRKGRCPMTEAGGPVCPRCKNEIDPESCWCGSGKSGHPYDLGHSFVPMGCDCGRVKREVEHTRLAQAAQDEKGVGDGRHNIHD